MREFIYRNFEHVLFVLLLVSRLGDIVSTYLASPKLKLETNPLAKKLGWRFIIFSLVICFVPYFNTAMAVMLIVPSLLVSASNTTKIWLVRTLGESEYEIFLLQLARKGKFSHALLGVLAASSFIILAGGMLCFLYPDPQRDWGFWFGFGIIGYGFALALHGSLYYHKLFKRARRELAEAVGTAA